MSSFQSWLKKAVQQWWILFLFSVYFNWIAFLYVSSKTRNKRWAVWAIVYAIPFIIMCFETVKITSPLYDVFTTYTLCSWLFSIFHGFKIRKEFLMRLEIRQQALQQEEEALRRKIEAEYFQSSSLGASRFTQKSVAPPPPPPPKKTMVNQVLNTHVEETASEPQTNQNAASAAAAIDLNTASESDIAALPGVGAVLAKKACQYRQNHNGFRTVDEFFEVIDLKPYLAQRVRPLVTVSSPSPASSNQNGRSRVVDY